MIYLTISVTINTPIRIAYVVTLQLPLSQAPECVVGICGVGQSGWAAWGHRSAAAQLGKGKGQAGQTAYPCIG